MNCEQTGQTIRRLRTEKGFTQKELADKMNISDKTVSKWERGLGCPDISVIKELAEIFSVSCETILTGNIESNEPKESSMKNNKYYICPECGSISVCTGNAEIICCSRKLQPLTPVKADESEKLTAEKVEYDWYISSDHPMSKDDYIPFAVYVTGDKMTFYKLYPEWNLSFRIPCAEHGTLMWYERSKGLLFMYL